MSHAPPISASAASTNSSTDLATVITAEVSQPGGGHPRQDGDHAGSRRRHGKGLPTGQTVATGAGRLPARWVIHTLEAVRQPETSVVNVCAVRRPGLRRVRVPLRTP
ncbi:hypothetical protein FE391_18010 [Nonomuraea sp. KC401]|nr:hypothetical protein [Nonomuraea sp. K271]TLF72010.1 hypothetical protein FE391_18010 [Nonomuraea sp. KC401]